MSLLERHTANLAVLLKHYNRLTRPMRRQLHNALINLPMPDNLAEEVSGAVLDDYVWCANLRIFVEERYEGPQIELVRQEVQ